MEVESLEQSARLDGDTRFSLLGKQMPAEKLAAELEGGSAIDFSGYYTRIINGVCNVDRGFPESIKASGLELEYSPLGYEGPLKRILVPHKKKSKEAKRVGSFDCKSLIRPTAWQSWRGAVPTCAKTNEACPVVAQVSKLVEASIQ